jgi:hypothetical protein
MKKGEGKSWEEMREGRRKEHEKNGEANEF